MHKNSLSILLYVPRKFIWKKGPAGWDFLYPTLDSVAHSCYTYPVISIGLNPNRKDH